MLRSPVVTVLAVVALTTACAPLRTPHNVEVVSEAQAYQAQYRPSSQGHRIGSDGSVDVARSQRLNRGKCMASQLAPPQPRRFDPADGELERLSRGDLLDVLVGEDQIFSGEYVVSRNGNLRLPHMAPVRAQGRSVTDVERDLLDALLSNGHYTAPPRVSVRVLDFAAARIHVAGAVFAPGPIEIGGVEANYRDAARQQARGANTDARNLTTALRSAGGVRPDADLSRVTLIRAGHTSHLDLRNAIDGMGFDDPMLLAGDRIQVASLGCFQDHLMKPNAVAPPGVKIYLSNLTKPADANALSAIGKDAREMPWGTRFLQAVTGMNCFGGTKLTNADRYAVLFSRNPITGQSVVIERRIEDLLRRADRDEFDPYLLPGDAIACYDSTVTNIVDVAKSFGTVVGAALLLSL